MKLAMPSVLCTLRLRCGEFILGIAEGFRASGKKPLMLSVGAKRRSRSTLLTFNLMLLPLAGEGPVALVTLSCIFLHQGGGEEKGVAP